MMDKLVRFWRWLLGKSTVLYWVVPVGDWNDPGSWSETKDGFGGAGVPDIYTDLFLGPKKDQRYFITCSGEMKPGRNLVIDGEGTVELGPKSSAFMLCVGDLVLRSGQWNSGRVVLELV